MSKQTGSSALAVGAVSHVGRVRTGNEDAFIAEHSVFGVADGMGGHQAGEVASAIAVQTLRDRLAGGAANIDVAEAAIVVANTAIYQGARDNVEQRGMGTTLTAMIVLNDREPTRRFVLLNVGDSRTYLLRGGRLRRVTVDHSYVQELVASGHITEVEARTHPRRNIVTRALGIEPTVRLDSWVLPFVKGDRYVLCSDGLVDEVDDFEIAQVLAAQRDVQRAAQALVDAANAHGGRDNVTVVVVDVLEGDVTVDDTADLDLDLVWIDQSPGMHIDADADRDPITEEIPIAGLGSPAPPVQSVQRRRFGFGTLLFWFGIAVVITGAVTLVLAVRNNASNDPDPVATTTVVATTTSVARTTTTTSPTTTSPTTTTAATPTSGG